MPKRYGDAAWRRKYEALVDEARRRLQAIERERAAILEALPQLRAKRRIAGPAAPKVLFDVGSASGSKKRGSKQKFAKLKKRAYELFEQDLGVAHVAKALNVSKSAVSRWKSAYVTTYCGALFENVSPAPTQAMVSCPGCELAYVEECNNIQADHAAERLRRSDFDGH